MIKVYVAGASKELARARYCIRVLQRIGVHITHDWTTDPGFSAGKNYTPAMARASAEIDLRGVRTADVLLLLVPSSGVVSTGCWAELGAALASGISIVVSGSCDSCVFTTMADAFFDTDHQAMGMLVNMNLESAL